MTLERWRRSDDGAVFEILTGEAPGPEPEGSQLPDAAAEPIEASGAVLAPRSAYSSGIGPAAEAVEAEASELGQLHRADPKHVRILARLWRSVLEAGGGGTYDDDDPA